MSKFNTKIQNSRKTTTHEGGVAYTKHLEDEWANMLFSFMLQSGNSGFYRTEDEAQSRYIDLTSQMIDKYGPEFVGKAAIFSRNELGMRTISELTAALLNKYHFFFYKKHFQTSDFSVILRVFLCFLRYSKGVQPSYSENNLVKWLWL